MDRPPSRPPLRRGWPEPHLKVPAAFPRWTGPELFLYHPVRDLQEFLLGAGWDRRPRGSVVAAAVPADGAARRLHDRGEVEAAGHEVARRPGAHLDPVVRFRERDNR